MIFNYRYFFLFLTFFGFYFSFGQKKDFNTDKYLVNQLLGFKQNTVKKIVEDKNGIIWIATEMGLYHYDGKSLKLFEDLQFPKLSNKRIKDLELDSVSGNIYFSSYPDENIVYKIINKKIHLVKKEDRFYKSYFLVKNTFSIKNKKIYSQIENYYLKNNLTFNHWGYQILYTKDSIIYYTQSQKILVFDKVGKMAEIKQTFTNKLKLLKFENEILLFDNGKAAILRGSEILPLQIDVAPELIKKAIISNNYIVENENNYYFEFENVLYKLNYKNRKIAAIPIISHPLKID